MRCLADESTNVVLKLSWPEFSRVCDQLLKSSDAVVDFEQRRVIETLMDKLSDAGAVATWLRESVVLELTADENVVLCALAAHGESQGPRSFGYIPTTDLHDAGCMAGMTNQFT